MRPCATLQRQEMRAVDYVNRYFANHGTLTELAETYAAVQTEAERWRFSSVTTPCRA